MQKFDRQGVFLAEWGSRGSGDGQFDLPSGLCTDQEGAIFVADTDNNRIVKLAPDGRHLATWGTFGEADGEFNWPAAVAVARDGSRKLFVVDR